MGLTRCYETEGFLHLCNVKGAAFRNYSYVSDIMIRTTDSLCTGDCSRCNHWYLSHQKPLCELVSVTCA